MHCLKDWIIAVLEFLSGLCSDSSVSERHVRQRYHRGSVFFVGKKQLVALRIRDSSKRQVASSSCRRLNSYSSCCSIEEYTVVVHQLQEFHG
jgi:hypothetical protein